MTSSSSANVEPIHQKRTEFAKLARQHESALMRAAKRMCGSDHDLAQDIVQDTFVSAYRAYLDGRFDGRNPGGWLLRILTNAFLFAKRKSRTESGLDGELLSNSDGESGNWNCSIAAPDQALLQATLPESLERALMSLPESQRVCVVLTDIEELPYAEVAESLGIPIGTVRSRLARARMAMLTFLRDEKLRGGENGKSERESRHNS